MPKQEHPLTTLDDSTAGVQEFLDNSAARDHFDIPRMALYGSAAPVPLFTNHRAVQR